MNNKPYLIALNQIPKMGPRTIAQCLARWPILEEMFRSSPQALIQAGLSPSMAQAIKGFRWGEVEADLRWQEASHHHLLTWEDDDYPSLLKEIHAPPPVLYACGELACLHQPTLAMVGSRKPSVTGQETAWRFAFELAQHALTIVSGLALGIDGQAHRAALAAGGKTIAVLGTGMNHLYPKQHRDLADKISQTGLLMSEFPLKTPPMARHFPRRNRIISGISLAIMVVEAAIKSGSLITARFALEQNREVLAIPGSILNPQARGCHHLLQQGATLVASIQDVLDELKLDSQPVTQNKKALSLVMDNENLVQCIGFEVTTVDQIMARSGLGVEKVVGFLATLELQGIVKSVPGGYMRCTE